MERTPSVTAGGAPSGPTKVRRRRAWWLVAAGVAVVVAVVGGLIVRDQQRQGIPPPTFLSLQKAPDPALHGTLAYLAGMQKFAGADPTTGGASWCIRVIATAGTSGRNALCISEADLQGMVGPQLVWRSDGRLEVTMFRSSGKETVEPGWQRVVDVRTGAVEETPAAQLPAAPVTPADPSVGPNGEQLAIHQNGGHTKIELTTSTGSRTVFDASGNPNYSVSLAGWSPDGKWFLVNDGRLLLVTVDDPAQTRVLVEDPSANGDVGSVGIEPYGLTGLDLLGAGD